MNALNAKGQNGGRKMQTDLSYISVEVCLYRRHEGKLRMKTERFVFHVPHRFLAVIDKAHSFVHEHTNVEKRKGATSGNVKKESQET
jgi:hypothetical protein